MQGSRRSQVYRNLDQRAQVAGLQFASEFDPSRCRFMQVRSLRPQCAESLIQPSARRVGILVGIRCDGKLNVFMKTIGYWFISIPALGTTIYICVNNIVEK